MRIALLLCLGLLCGLPAGHAAERQPARVKAAFILNIARFVEWPASAFEGHESELWLCLLREDPFGEALDAIRGKYVGARGLSVAVVNSLEETKGCNVLFIPPSQLAWFKERMANKLSAPLLTVTDLTDAANMDGGQGVAMVTLVRAATRIGIEIHLEHARQAGLKLSSELLKLGKILE